VSAERGLAGLALAAGAGERLWPLTRWVPKALCPVGLVPLVDHAIARLRSVTDAVAVNVHHGRDALLAHLGAGANAASLHRSIEEHEGLGTAGALGVLRPWLDGRDVIVTNADAWLGGPPDHDLRWFVEGWDRARVRLMCVRDARRGDFGDLRYAGVCLLPGAMVAQLHAEPSGLYEVLWRAEHAAGRLDLVEWSGPFVDCGTVGDYLDANLAWSGGTSVIDPGAQVEGSVQECVVWSGARVSPTAVLRRAVVGPEWVVHAR
jgi:NDP-sugar pyrophosphorylase family protein